MFRPLLGIAALILGLTALDASAGMYKWVDDQGNVHYSQIPPRDREVTRIKAPRPPVSAQAAESPSTDEPENDGEQAPQDPARASLEAQVKQRNCAAAKRNLALYSDNRSIMRDGQEVVLKDEERKRLQAEMRAKIEKYCK